MYTMHAKNRLGTTRAKIKPTVFAQDRKHLATRVRKLGCAPAAVSDIGDVLPAAPPPGSSGSSEEPSCSRMAA